MAAVAGNGLAGLACLAGLAGLAGLADLAGLSGLAGLAGPACPGPESFHRKNSPGIFVYPGDPTFQNASKNISAKFFLPKPSKDNQKSHYIDEIRHCFRGK